MAYHDDFKVKNGLVVTSTATFLSTVTAISTTTGAVQISGGVGIAKDVYIGGSLYAGPIYSNGSLIGNSSTYVNNIYGGNTGSLVIQRGPNQTSFIPIGGYGTVLYSDGNTATWIASGSIASNTATNSNNVYINQNSETNNAGGKFYVAMSSLYDDYSPISVTTPLTWNDTSNILINYFWCTDSCRRRGYWR